MKPSSASCAASTKAPHQLVHRIVPAYVLAGVKDGSVGLAEGGGMGGPGLPCQRLVIAQCSESREYRRRVERIMWFDGGRGLPIASRLSLPNRPQLDSATRLRTRSGGRASGVGR